MERQEPGYKDQSSLPRTSELLLWLLLLLFFLQSMWRFLVREVQISILGNSSWLEYEEGRLELRQGSVKR